MILTNTKLVILAVFPNLVTVGGDVVVSNNDRLLRLGDNNHDAFPELREVGGSVVISGNPFVEKFEGFEKLRVVRFGDVRVENNQRLKTIATNAVTLGQMVRQHVLGGDQKSVKPFQNLHRIGGGVSISQNQALTEIHSAFPSMRRVDGGLTIGDNQKLEKIEDSFELLDVVQQQFTVSNCAVLEHVSNSFPKLRVVGQSFLISDNFKFEKVDAGSWTRLFRVGGSVMIQSVALQSVSFFLSLQVVVGNVKIGQNCTNLQSLDGLQVRPRAFPKSKHTFLPLSW